MTRLYCCRLDLRTGQESSLSGHLDLARGPQGDPEPGIFSMHPDLSREPFEGCMQWASSPLKKTLSLEDLKHMLGQGCQNASQRWSHTNRCTPPRPDQSGGSRRPLPMGSAGAERGRSQLGLQADSPASCGGERGWPAAADQLGTWMDPAPKVSVSGQ